MARTKHLPYPASRYQLDKHRDREDYTSDAIPPYRAVFSLPGSYTDPESPDFIPVLEGKADRTEPIWRASDNEMERVVISRTTANRLVEYVKAAMPEHMLIAVANYSLSDEYGIRQVMALRVIERKDRYRWGVKD